MGGFASRRERDQADTRQTSRGSPASADGAPNAPAERREPLDEQIASLLVSLEQEPASESVPPVPRAAARSRAQRDPAASRPWTPQRRRFGTVRGRMERTELVFLLTAAVLGLAIGVLIPLLLNS